MRNLSRKLKRRLCQIRLVATDLDGTLLNNNGEISEVTRKSVRQLDELGIGLAIMTGRAHTSAEAIADDLGIKSPIISLDGGLVRLPHSDEVIFASYIRPQIVRAVIAESERNLSSIALLTDAGMVRAETSTILPGYIDSLGIRCEVVDDLSFFVRNTIRIIVGAETRDAVQAAARIARGVIPRVETSIYRSSTHVDRWYLEVRNRSCSKATGLVHLERFFGISKKEVAVMGDFRNDVEAFRRAGTGVAMRNAVRELKEKADMVTESTNDDDGAAEFFDIIYEIRNNNRNGQE